MPKVSIVITAYNAERFIKASLLAALAQDYPNFEVVMVDDGSTDSTESISKTIHDSRLRYFRKERIGRSRALNEAISLAKGRYIAINDADDLSFPSRIGYTVKYFRLDPKTALLGTSYEEASQFLDELPESALDQVTEAEDVPALVSPSRLYRSMPFAHSTIVFSKESWQRVGGYDEQLSICVDYDFILRVAQFGKIGLLPKETILYRSLEKKVLGNI